MELLPPGTQEYNETAATLEKLLRAYSSHKDVASGFAYQIGCDRLAGYYIQQCKAREATVWYQKVVDARRRQRTLTNELLWHRPPEKLLLYYMFIEAGGSDLTYFATPEAIEGAKQFRESCPEFKNGFESRFLAPYDEFKKPEAWRLNTALDDKVISYVNGTLLNKGWRY